MNYQCSECGWTGNKDEVNWTTTFDGCGLGEMTPLCPRCGYFVENL
jgi:DNA-directed RNA polymerase subunit RPC12/RpoP